MYMNKLSLNSGVVYGQQLKEVYDYCKESQCALPGVNVIGSHSINAALEASRQAKAPLLVTFSSGGAHYIAGKTISNEDNRAAVAGCVAGALHVHLLAKHYGVPVILHTDHCPKKNLSWLDGMIHENGEYYKTFKRPLFSSHMLDLSEESLEDNLEISARYLEKLSALNLFLEVEIGVTGGEEDGIDNTGVDSSRLYTQPDDVLKTYDTLNHLGNFTLAASFGNTHGVYKPGNVVLRPEILKNSQERVQKERNTAPKPLSLVFHGGSGSEKEKIEEAVRYGVVKMNIDTDTQWGFCHPIKTYMDQNDAYLHSQVGNPEGEGKPNKKYFDPRVWLLYGERGMTARLVEAFRDLNSYEKFDF